MPPFVYEGLMRGLAAAPILLFVLPVSAQDMNAPFRQGMDAIAVAHKAEDEDRRDELLDNAIATFRKILIANPRLVRVQLELARALFLKDEDGLARDHFECVLAGNPPAGVALNVNRFLSHIRARKRWSVRVGFALAPDMNLGGGSDEGIIYIHGLPFRRDQEEPTRSGIGIAAWAGGEYQYPLSRQWRLRAGATSTALLHDYESTSGELRFVRLF